MTLSPDNIKESYHDILSYLIGDGPGNGACGIDIVGQFQPEDNSRVAVPRNINAAFLISLSEMVIPDILRPWSIWKRWRMILSGQILLYFIEKGLACY
jgi:hypothetical protein